MVSHTAPKSAPSVNSEHRNLPLKSNKFEFEISYRGKEESHASWERLIKLPILMHSFGSNSTLCVILLSIEPKKN